MAPRPGGPGSLTSTIAAWPIRADALPKSAPNEKLHVVGSEAADALRSVAFNGAVAGLQSRGLQTAARCWPEASARSARHRQQRATHRWPKGKTWIKAGDFFAD